MQLLLVVLLLVQVPVPQAGQEDVLRDAVMVFGVRVGEEIIANADGLLCLQESVVVILEDLARRLSTPVGLNRDRGAMRVGAGDHQNAVSP